jgi:hypothetical protein
VGAGVIGRKTAAVTGVTTGRLTLDAQVALDGG